MAEKTVEPPAGGGDGRARETTRASEQHVRPPVDIYETPDGLTVVADLPGAGRDDVDVEVEDGVLTLRARTKHALEGEPIHREFELVNFYRQFQLSDAVDAARISAEFKHGVLTLRLPKAEAAKPKHIPVRVG